MARLTDLTTFKWLLVMLPELKAQQLVHNEYYGGDEAERAQLKSRAAALDKEMVRQHGQSARLGGAPARPL